MCKILQFLVAIVLLECITHLKIGEIGSSSRMAIFPSVEGKPFNNDEIQQADIYYAEVSDDISIRLYEILNKNFQYHRYSLDNINKNKKIDRNSLLNSKDQQKVSDDDNDDGNESEDDDDERSDYERYSDVIYSKNYTPYFVHPRNSTSIPQPLSSKTKSNDNNNTTTFITESISSEAQIPFSESSTTNKLNSHPFNNFTGTSIDRNTKISSSFYHGVNIDEETFYLHNNDTNTSTPFDYTVECMDEEKICNYVCEKLEYAGNYISNIFNIYNTINVDVHILPFCQYLAGDNCNSITALTYAPSFVTLNVTGHGIFSYPQALVKQLDIGDVVKRFSTYDISLYFNTDYLKENNFGNYLLVTAHELIHGMGFFHLMTTASEAFKISFPEDRIIPQPLIHNYRTKAGKEWAYQGWIPFTVFDRYIVEVSQPNVYIYSGIEEYLEDVKTHKIVSEENVINHVNNLDISLNTDVYSKSLVSSFTTKKALGFRAYDGEIITLQTFKEYEPMSSVSHIHSPFSCDSSIDCYVPKEKLNEVDENYLMYYTIITRSTNQLVDRYSRDCEYGFIGKKIVKILKTIGWTEREDMTYFKTYEDDILSRESTLSNAYSLFSSSSYNNSLIFIIFLTFITLFL